MDRILRFSNIPGDIAHESFEHKWAQYETAIPHHRLHALSGLVVRCSTCTAFPQRFVEKG